MRGWFVMGVTMFALALGNGHSQEPQERPFITYGMAKVSVGMTVEQVQQSLSRASHHVTTLPDHQDTAIVYMNTQSEPYGDEGEIIFANGRVKWAAYQMPVVSSADELAQEIAGAVESVEKKTCYVSTFAGHGTGGEHSDVIFDCGSRRITVITAHTFGSSARNTNVSIEIGRL